MKTTRRMVSLLIAAVMLTASIAGVAFASEEEDYVWPETPEKIYTLSVANTVAADTPCGLTLTKIDEVLRERSNGAVQLDIYWDGTLATVNEIGEGLATGTIDIGLVNSGVVSNYTPKIDVLSLPFIISGRDQMRAVTDQYFDEITEGIYETLGITLGLWEFGFRHLVTRDKEINTIEDMQGLNIRVLDGQLYAATFNALGCVPTSVPTTEIVTALQQGMLDGVEAPYTMIVAQQQYSFCKYLTLIGYNYSVGIPILSRDVAESLPEEVVDLIKDVFWEYRFYSRERWEEADEGYKQTCIDGGMIVKALSDEEMERFRDRVATVWEEYEDKIGKDLIEKVSNAE